MGQDGYTPHFQEGWLGWRSPAERMGPLGGHGPAEMGTQQGFTQGVSPSGWSSLSQPSSLKTCSNSALPMPNRRSPGVHRGDAAGGEGRDLGRDLHVKGPSEPYCCSGSPNRCLHSPARQLFPEQSSLPLPHPWKNHESAGAASWAVLRVCQDPLGAATSAFLPGPHRH